MHVSVDAFEYFILSKIPPCMLKNAHRLTAFVYAIHIHLDTTLKGLQRLLDCKYAKVVNTWLASSVNFGDKVHHTIDFDAGHKRRSPSTDYTVNIWVYLFKEQDPLLRNLAKMFLSCISVHSSSVDLHLLFVRILLHSVFLPHRLHFPPFYFIHLF